MLIKSPDERAELWDKVSKATDEEERALLLQAVAQSALEELRSEFDLYSDFEDPFVETFLVLDSGRLLLDPEMLKRYQALGNSDDQAGRRFFDAVIDRLGSLASTEETDPGLRKRGADLYVIWREHLGTAEEEFLTVACVAHMFRVRPQTVYRWINQGKVTAFKTPGGGGTRIPARELRTRPITAGLSKLAAEAIHEGAVGPVRRLESRTVPAYKRALEAIEAGRVPQLPRRRYLPERAGLLEAPESSPVEAHVEEFREGPQSSPRRPAFRPQKEI